MKKIIVSIIVIFYGLIVPLPAQSALVDVTAMPWDFNIQSNNSFGLDSVFNNNTLIFMEQIPTNDKAFLSGQILWGVQETTLMVTNFVGELKADNITLIGDVGGLLTAFQGIITNDGGLIIGQFSGINNPSAQGFFWATPVGLPPSGLLMLLSLGGWLITHASRRRQA